MDYNKLKVAELRDELTKRGLETTGVKAVLVQRLDDDDEKTSGGVKTVEDEPPARPTRGRGKAAQKEKEEEKVEEKVAEEKPPTNKRSLSTTLAEMKQDGKKRKTVKAKIDPNCYLNGQVYEDYDCMLNQTNIGQNNNKFYVIQLIESGSRYYTFNRWGRVGETGQMSQKGPFDLAKAIKDFEGKFKDKTGNIWSDRENFEARAGKYTLIEIDHDAEAELAEKIAKLEENQPTKTEVKKKEIKPSALPNETQNLIKLIFDNDMFKTAMESFDIDVKKMPLGAISKSQIAKGYEVLLDLQKELKQAKPNRTNINNLSSKFYTLIPHSFGRRVPPPIDSDEAVQKKMEMLNVLGDIEIAQQLKEEEKKTSSGDEATQEHPYDVQYKTLKADLQPISKSDPTWKIIETYTRETMGYRKLKLVDVFTMSRHGEEKRFAEHDEIENRRLLWHGTNVAVVAAIVASGLRIMPHSGGRVGKGIYLASENGKSAGYVGTSGKTGIMFLAEAALGKEHHITRDDSSLVKAPNGYDCIIAKGHTEPDPTKDIKIDIDGKEIVVPQGKPIPQPQYKASSFTQSEYLVYKESQVRLRYLIRAEFEY